MKQAISQIFIREASPLNITINASLDYEANAAKNRIWYRGDASELSQLYAELNSRGGIGTFWGAKCSPGNEILKRHTGLPSIIVDTLASVTLTDLGRVEWEHDEDGKEWEQIAKENNFPKLMENALKETLYIGDGAFKISFDTALSAYPILEYYPGDQIEYTTARGRITEVVFKTKYSHKGTQFLLRERYGYGYIKNNLFKDGNEVALNSIPETTGLSDYFFAGYEEHTDGTVNTRGGYMMAIPLIIYRSSRYVGRGQSIFDRKVESFDSLDEAWSQWMDALRSGRSREYIPDSLLPRNPDTGEVMAPNPFDNRYIKTDSDMQENAKNQITLQQPSIPHESYCATYITALDLCLQGIISPSTLGIDVKKLDNAEAQREKEKATLYTRAAIIDALTGDIEKLAEVSMKAYRDFCGKKELSSAPTVTFGEYANPSFESQVETITKAKTGGIMSLEACIEELYGDTKDKEWKDAEVQRLKAEQGIMEVDEFNLQKDYDNLLNNNGGDVNA